MTNTRDWQDAPLDAHDGERFLEVFDQALSDREVSGPHADVAKFGREVSLKLPESDTRSAEAKIRVALGAMSPVRGSGIRETSVERRFGVLNLAALVAFVLLSTAAGWIWWNQKPNATAPRKNVAAEDTPEPPKKPDIVPPPKPELTFNQKLARPMTFDFTGMTFDAALAKCRELGQVEIITDPKSKPAAENLFTVFKVKDMELRHVLSWICTEYKLVHVEWDNKVYIGAHAAEPPELNIYDVSDLKYSAADQLTILKTALAAKITDTDSLTETGGRLVVMQPPAVQKEISQILKALRDHGQDRELSILTEPSEEPWKTALDERLKKYLTFNYENKAALEILAAIQAETGTSLIVAGEGGPTTLHVTEVSASVAFDWIARLCDLTYGLRDGAVVIGRPGMSNPERCVCLYNVADLATKPDDAQTAAGIAQSIREMLYPDSWLTGLGTSIDVLDGRLLVVQSPAMQKEVAKFIKELRTRTVLRTNHGPPPTVPKAVPNDPVDVQKLKSSETEKSELRE